MNPSPAPIRSPATPRVAARFTERWLPWLLGALSLLPLAWNHAAFRDLFYFEDELHLLDELARDHFSHWIFAMFGDTWIPLFKLAWGGLVVTSGSYLLLVWAVWLNHAMNVALLARLVRRLGGDAWAMSLAAATFGVGWYHFETLGWTLQWMNVMAVTPLLVGVLLLSPRPGVVRPVGRTAVALALLAIVGVLACPRGLLGGAVFGAVALLAFGPWRSAGARWGLAAAGLIPALVGVVVVMRLVAGTSAGPGLTAHADEKLHYALAYFGGSPVRWILDNPRTDLGWVASLAVGKLFLFALAFVVTPPRWRAALLGLFLLDLGNATLMGIGRFHTGVETSVSSRYQYFSALALAPAVGIVFARAVRRLPVPPGPRVAFSSVAIVAFALFIALPWRRCMNDWRGWRGADLRAALAMPPEKAPQNFSRIPWIDNERTRQLVRQFDLH